MSRHLIYFFKANVIFRCRDIYVRGNLSGGGGRSRFTSTLPSGSFIGTSELQSAERLALNLSSLATSFF